MSSSPRPPRPVDLSAKDDRALVLSPALKGDLLQRSRDGYPFEVCGLFLGRQNDREVLVDHLVQIENLNQERRQDRYLLDPQGFLRADQEARQQGLDIVGIWHTHPDHPAIPSVTDAASAWEGYAYAIVSVNDGEPETLRSWTFQPPLFVEQDVIEQNVVERTPVEQGVSQDSVSAPSEASSSSSTEGTGPRETHPSVDFSNAGSFHQEISAHE